MYTFSVSKAVVTATARRTGSVGVPREQRGLTPRRRSRPSFTGGRVPLSSQVLERGQGLHL